MSTKFYAVAFCEDDICPRIYFAHAKNELEAIKKVVSSEDLGESCPPNTPWKLNLSTATDYVEYIEKLENDKVSCVGFDVKQIN